MKIIIRILDNIFSYGVLLSIFAGALAMVMFCVAFIIGGEIATTICVFVHKQYFPIIIRICAIAVGCGVATMYLKKMKVFSVEKD